MYSGAIVSNLVRSMNFFAKLRVYGQFCIETIHGRLKRNREFNGLSFSPLPRNS